MRQRQTIIEAIRTPFLRALPGAEAPGSGSAVRVILITVMLATALLASGACTGGVGEGTAEGKALFENHCAVCHGPAGRGKSGVTRSLARSQVLRSSNDQQLLQLLATGLPASHPDNDSGVPMPPRGGSAKLDDQQLVRIIGYLRTLQR